MPRPIRPRLKESLAAKRVIYLDTVMSVAPQFDELSRALLPPDTEWWHIVDEMLAKVALAQGGLSPFLYRRVADHAQAAQQAGADVLQLTCSSISPCVDAIQSLVDVPVLKIDVPKPNFGSSVRRHRQLAEPRSAA